ARRQILAHHPIARFGHPGHVVERSEGTEAYGEPADVEVGGELFDAREVLAELVPCLVRIARRRAGELELAAGLQRDRGPIRKLEGDDGALFFDRLGVERSGEPLEHRPNSPRPVVGDRTPVAVDPYLFVLRSDAPRRARLAPSFE